MYIPANSFYLIQMNNGQYALAADQKSIELNPETDEREVVVDTVARILLNTEDLVALTMLLTQTLNEIPQEKLEELMQAQAMEADEDDEDGV